MGLGARYWQAFYKNKGVSKNIILILSEIPLYLYLRSRLLKKRFRKKA
jgi:hypothetical protein